MIDRRGRRKQVLHDDVVPIGWRQSHPHHCPVVLRDGGKSVGPCWHYLKQGVCPIHGKIYEEESKELAHVHARGYI